MNKKGGEEALKTKGVLIAILSVLFLTSCSQGFAELDRGMQNTYTFPEEPSKQTLMNRMENRSFQNAEDFVSSTFPLLDKVRGNQSNQEARIYVTQRFGVKELSNIVSEKFKPDRESDYNNGKKVLIYADTFITFKQSEQSSDVTLIEIASDRFVRNNYSPNFFNGLFALWVLDEVLDVDDWGKKRRKACLSGGCYGGYSSEKYRSGSSGSFRGSSGRGGGPSSGK
ncbi:hypothetical protein N783_14235 [Pontibacillus marinus BH030004 = DSM 16465]|uniref:DUF4247 domain-containing protein n=1 Tax=Pontibacillus marinus BH030004 = DSM 16465 TaxID=1385511 RepID=A0A0A5FUN2_9BACI|nr:hypothetical protein N783_14235 [Pontibacillus marinus BH030004 = DSM 16465]